MIDYLHIQSENPEPTASLCTPRRNSVRTVGSSGGPTLLLASWPHLQMAASHSASVTHVLEML